MSFRLCCLSVLALLVPPASSNALGQSDAFWKRPRDRMVDEAIVAAGIIDTRVCDAMRATPRHEFVPLSQRPHSYFDMALPIGGGQTISPPFIVASMTLRLDPQPSDRVLEIGTGSGYQAAVLSPLVDQVYSIEIVESLARRSSKTLQRLGYKNVHTKSGDGFQGWEEFAPFDKIIVTCSPETVPVALADQLREGGRMVIPLGERYQQAMYLLTKNNGRLERESLEPTFFVPMTGRAEELRDQLDESGIPELINGSFEVDTRPGVPDGWYYVRQAQVLPLDESPDGSRILRFKNETAGRGAQALQALGLDGRRVRQLELSVWVRTHDVRAGQLPRQLPHVVINYYDQRRGDAGSQILGPWQGTHDWSRRQSRFKVPGNARLAVLAVGLFGGTGELEVDKMELKIIQVDTE